ncbi:MAG: response regulator [Pseudobdellovibrionaceae bacterium]
MTNLRTRKKLNLHFAVVEDDDEFRSFLTDFFHFNGFSVEPFQNPVQFFEKYTDDLLKFTAIISDVNMPQMSGFDLLRKVKSIHKELPIILISAASNNSDAQQALDLGANYFLHKPFAMSLIQSSVDQIIQQKCH